MSDIEDCESIASSGSVPTVSVIFNDKTDVLCLTDVHGTIRTYSFSRFFNKDTIMGIVQVIKSESMGSMPSSYEVCVDRLLPNGKTETYSFGRYFKDDSQLLVDLVTTRVFEGDGSPNPNDIEDFKVVKPTKSWFI